MSQGDYHKARVLLNEIYQSIQGRDFGDAFTYVVRILAELDWGTGKYSQSDQWLTELQGTTVTMDVRNQRRLRMGQGCLVQWGLVFGCRTHNFSFRKPDSIAILFSTRLL